MVIAIVLHLRSNTMSSNLSMPLLQPVVLRHLLLPNRM
jgi:hypothetical protein